ncbi:MAG: nitroreductase [Spirochaetales bacterium]|nr:nitroreductase [Spirochaetales bacterium]
MDAIDCLMTRRSIKSYTDRMVDDETLWKILDAGTMAPTAKNLQSPVILCVKNKKIRDKMSSLNAKVLGTESDPFYGAPIVLVVLADRNNPNHVYDGSLVMGNLLTAAHALGVSACWINRAKEVFDSEEGKKLLKDLGVDGDLEGIGNCVLGYSDKDIPKAKPRKPDYIMLVE